MNLTAKKVYRRKCNKLVSVCRHVDGQNITVVCNSCNNTSCSWNQVGWKYTGG